jgi:hypothetical protein
MSHLVNGHFRHFSANNLWDFLNRFDQKVTIQIGPHKTGEPYEGIGFGM